MCGVEWYEFKNRLQNVEATFEENKNVFIIETNYFLIYKSQSLDMS